MPPVRETTCRKDVGGAKANIGVRTQDKNLNTQKDELHVVLRKQK